jgi:hypothetical protein
MLWPDLCKKKTGSSINIVSGKQDLYMCTPYAPWTNTLYSAVREGALYPLLTVYVLVLLRCKVQYSGRTTLLFSCCHNTYGSYETVRYFSGFMLSVRSEHVTYRALFSPEKSVKTRSVHFTDFCSIMFSHWAVGIDIRLKTCVKQAWSYPRFCCQNIRKQTAIQSYFDIT